MMMMMMMMMMTMKVDDDGDDEDAWSMDMAREHAHYGARWVNACVCGVVLVGIFDE